MDITRNGQTVAFEVNASGDLEQTSPYVSKAGDPNREYVAYRVEDVIVIAQDKFLARQALKQHRVELVEAMRAELDDAPEDTLTEVSRETFGNVTTPATHHPRRCYCARHEGHGHIPGLLGVGRYDKACEGDASTPHDPATCPACLAGATDFQGR